MAAIFEHTEAIRLSPQPGFVVKTKIVDGKGDHIYLTKVFINICHEPRVPKPSLDFQPEVVFPLIVRNEWEIPIIVSLEKRAVDKKGVPSFVYDCCINSECFQWVQVSRDLRLILVEWALESVEMMHELVLEREYALPKMLCKGELSETEITEEDLKNGLQKKLLELKQNETAGLIEELEVRPWGDGEEEGEQETLPDLTNIDGKRQKPLIEEIGQMSLDGEPKESHIFASQVSQSLNKDTHCSSSSERSVSEVLRYKFTFKRELRGNQCFVLFESRQLTKNLEVSYLKDPAGTGTVITLRNTDSLRVLESLNYLEIPMPQGYKPYQSFLLEKHGQLYIFCASEK
ncbi:hypothetical protein METBIDRAFT_9388 [Metschnikowia bicuspidata var. bicuspidata NRRL YB-4993]|uniref:PIH1 N-terminal domain-containing protein n=1 Tax=Metschnikowia bicuspidata var. bicuspidata NRRL YB-4993 TaxID=869754 RepID=A0A1A0HGR5_9ASCO|nr:hypothetical protein METBIDRAFT_9388 [Metschnikowia bicuspidata var. bicuspidata NRRL YB-4993]OBA23072.1 hypothetical protein METBIDRAFT_9388 [Metschnikowia bicuspidata var. bicuspidata NRRL YB-4993]